MFNPMALIRTGAKGGWLAGMILLGTSLLVSRPLAQSQDFHLYVAFGQSNMEGGPGGTGLATPARFQVMQAVDCPGLNPPRTKGSFYTAVPPISRCTQGPGIAYWFGRNMVDSLPENIKIGIINVAVAGCKIELFDKDTYQAYASGVEPWMKTIIAEYGGSPYGRMVEVAKAAQKEGIIKGFLLHQGESNNGDQQWPNKVKNIYDDLMAELQLDPKRVPLLAGELVNADVNGATAGHNTIIAKLPTVLPNSYVVPSNALGNPTPDRMHFNADGYKEFGRRFAATMLKAQRAIPTARLADERPPGFALGEEVRLRGNRRLSLAFEVPRPTLVSLKAFAPHGGEIAEFAGRVYPAGRHAVELAREALPTGLVILEMKAGAFSASRKVLIGAQ
jgi:hypothetical protein